MTQSISKSSFKPKVLEILRNVEKSGKEIIITDHGRPVLKIVPFTINDWVTDLGELKNSVLKYDDPFEPVEVTWEASKS